MVQKMIDLRFLLHWCLIDESFHHGSFARAEGYPLQAGVFCTVQDLVLAFAAGGTGVAVDAVEAVVLGDSVGVVQGRLPRGVDGGGAVVLGALDRSRRRMRRIVPDDRIAGRILDPGGDDHRSSRVHALPGRRAHDRALLQLAGRAIIVLLAAGWWLVFRWQHVRQHRPFFLHVRAKKYSKKYSK